MKDMFFNGWTQLLQGAVVGTLVYAGLIVCLRITGKRTLSKWNAFDFAVTVALGSTLASAFLSQSVSLSQGLLAVALLVGLQFGITSLAVRLAWFRQLIKAQPTLLFCQGEFLPEPMRVQRVTRSEVCAAIRAAGCGTLVEVAAVVLETDGSFSVIERSGLGCGSALQGVEGAQGLASPPG